MKIINLTPHDVTLIMEDRKIVFERQTPNERGYIENIPRVDTQCLATVDVGGVPVVPFKKEVLCPPAKVKDTIYIVSYVVLDQMSDRTDLIAPDTTDAVKDDVGNVIGVKRFLRHGNSRDFNKTATIGDLIKGNTHGKAD